MSDAGQQRLILASASPRRAALLRQLGLPFEQVVSPEEEPVPDGSPAEIFARTSAQAKARAVRRLIQARSGSTEPVLVIGADTVVCRGRTILGKPADGAAAAAMLRSLSGRTHRVCTGICVAGDQTLELDDCVVTRVRMRLLSPAEIAGYVAGGEPLDKAGAYGIQGLGARFIERIEGCYYNVVGLPLARLCALLEAAGYRFPPVSQPTVTAA
ncbi:MAG: Maf family protein [Candidatus Latescibacterota bacterium]